MRECIRRSASNKFAQFSNKGPQMPTCVRDCPSIRSVSLRLRGCFRLKLVTVTVSESLASWVTWMPVTVTRDWHSGR